MSKCAVGNVTSGGKGYVYHQGNRNRKRCATQSGDRMILTGRQKQLPCNDISFVRTLSRRIELSGLNER